MLAIGDFTGIRPNENSDWAVLTGFHIVELFRGVLSAQFLVRNIAKLLLRNGLQKGGTHFNSGCQSEIQIPKFRCSVTTGLIAIDSLGVLRRVLPSVLQALQCKRQTKFLLRFECKAR